MDGQSDVPRSLIGSQRGPQLDALGMVIGLVCWAVIEGLLQAVLLIGALVVAAAPRRARR